MGFDDGPPTKSPQTSSIREMLPVEAPEPISKSAYKKPDGCTTDMTEAEYREFRAILRSLTSGRTEEFTRFRAVPPARQVIRLAQLVTRQLETDGSLAEIRPPCTIVGDIHGQYEDLLRIFSDQAIKQTPGKHGFHALRHQRYVFLGDYVDRGGMSIHCVLIVFLLKIFIPKRIILLRGNHEARAINYVYGFYDEVIAKFGDKDGPEVYEEINDAFAWLPFAAVVGGKVLCMHGGISPILNSLQDIHRIPRPLDDPTEDPLALDLLWADPAVGLKGFTKNMIRGISVNFGANAVAQTCAKLGVTHIVRGHQMMINGYAFFAESRLITVFSAPRYNADRSNAAAVMRIDKDGVIAFDVYMPSETSLSDNLENRWNRGRDEKSITNVDAIRRERARRADRGGRGRTPKKNKASSDGTNDSAGRGSGSTAMGSSSSSRTNSAAKKVRRAE